MKKRNIPKCKVPHCNQQRTSISQYCGSCSRAIELERMRRDEEDAMIGRIRSLNADPDLVIILEEMCEKLYAKE